MSSIRDFYSGRIARRRTSTEASMADDVAVRDGALNGQESGPEAIGADTDGPLEEKTADPQTSHLRLALMSALVVVVALAALTGWLGFRAYHSHQADQQRNLFLQVGRQGALNLTTIDWQEADADVKRIMDAATGTFYDDFQNRSASFIDVVKKAKSKSVGTITEAGVESESDDAAQVLVAVSVKTSNADAAEQESRAWRMRISVQKVGTDAKVSNVEFVP